ncbi:MAG: hypothetical protein QOF94_947, partial [Acidobacteriaceae bacterium]
VVESSKEGWERVGDISVDTFFEFPSGGPLLGT